MKIRNLIVIFSMSLFYHCAFHGESNHRQYIIRSEKEHYWEGNKNDINYKYQVDSITHRIFGKLIIDNRDTLDVRGYEKGNLYPTYYLPNDSFAIATKEKCMFFFRFSNFENDTLMLNRPDRDSTCTWIEDGVALIRKRKNDL